MLAYITLIVFGLLAVLTLVVDIGFVTLTRVQMQNAADAAAVEAVRRSDAIDIDAVLPDGAMNVAQGPDGYASDCIRRLAARDVVRWTFDDDFDAGTEETRRQLGAGPRVAFVTEGIGDLDAAREMALPDDGRPPVYKPDLRLNRNNVPHGDIVSGTFAGYDASPLPDEAADYTQPGPDDPDPARRTRENFSPSEDVPDEGASPLVPCPDEIPDITLDPADPYPWNPPSGTGALSETAILVRLRRAGNGDGLDDIPDPDIEGGSGGVSSTGGTIPLLFGRGALIADGDVDAPVRVRRDGITVRASAVAAALPVLAAEVAPAGVGRPERVAPIVIDTALARTLASAAGPFEAAVDVDGQVVSGGGAASLNLDVSQLAVFLADERGQLQERPLLFVGDALDACGAACTLDALPEPTATVAWLPVRDVVAGAPRIVGFVRARVTVVSDVGVLPGDLSGMLTIESVSPADPVVLRPSVAARHASARLWREGPDFDAAALQAVRVVTGCLAGTPEPLLCPAPVNVLLRAPALVR